MILLDSNFKTSLSCANERRRNEAITMKTNKVVPKFAFFHTVVDDFAIDGSTPVFSASRVSAF